MVEVIDAPDPWPRLRIRLIDIAGVELPLSRSDIAGILGVRPQSVSRLVRQLDLEGFAAFDERHVTFLDLDALAEEVQPFGFMGGRRKVH